MKSQRVPCGDDMCTGILDEQGICGYCGRKYSLPPGVTPIVVSDEEPLPPLEAELPTSPVESELDFVPETDLQERIPCGDDLCTGILDEKGVCGYCGRSFPDLMPK